MTRILIADDQHIVRRCLSLLLKTDGGMQVVGEVASGAEAIEVIDQLRPDILITDLAMPDVNGLELLDHLRRLVPTARGIVVTMMSDAPFVRHAMKLGAWGYLLKSAMPDELIEAVRTVVSGRRYICKELQHVDLSSSDPSSSDPLDQLTPRELDVLRMVAEGKTAGEIGKELGISPRTVENHRAHCVEKLGLASSSELVRYYLRRREMPPTTA